MEQIRNWIVRQTAQNGMLGWQGFPCVGHDGQYDLRENGGWVGGFWTGLNWLCYRVTKEAMFRDTAVTAYQRLHNRLWQQPETLDHDIGFLYGLSILMQYRCDPATPTTDIVRAAELLKQRYQPAGRFIRAWNVWDKTDPFVALNDGRMIMDCMYNIPLLFFVAQQFHDREAGEIAREHAKTCLKYMVRPDGSTAHTFVIDPVTGQPRFQQTRQGYADDSCWARGHAWAIGGFAIAYRYTGYRPFLEAAERTATYFIQHNEADFVPMWDFCLPTKQGEERDSSAAAIAASGMLEIGLPYFTAYAKDMVSSLFHNYSTYGGQSQTLLLHACANKPSGDGNNDVSLIFGDYFFAEAVMKLSGMQGNSIW